MSLNGKDKRLKQKKLEELQNKMKQKEEELEKNRQKINFERNKTFAKSIGKICQL